MNANVIRGALASLMLACTASLSAAEWSWQWARSPAAGVANTPTAEVCPFRYGKDWAYTLEIDDGPALTLEIAQPLLAKQQFTDAPPGVRGGKAMPFVGGSSVMVVRIGGNNTFLSWDDLRKLRAAGWEVLSHSYFHAGRTWGEPPEILSAEQIRNDLFWSQAIIAQELGGRAPISFVYPNGYTDYAKYLGEFGMLSGTRVGGSGGQMAYDAKTNLLDLPRSYLDEGNWKAWGKGEAMWDFPAGNGPAVGQLVIDFTHGIDKPASENYVRWQKRLETIGSMYGKGGKDNVWSAGTGEIIGYVNARRHAKVSIDGGKLAVSLPDEIPGTRLTVKVTGIDGELADVPAGATVYRDGQTLWVTTPLLGQGGASAPMPAVQRIYAGSVKSITFERPVRLAAVRLLQQGRPAAGYKLNLAALTPDGKTVSMLKPDEAKLGETWGVWRMYTTIPNREAILADRLDIAADPSLTQMEVWVTP